MRTDSSSSPLKKLNIPVAFGLILIIASSLSLSVFAASTSNFAQTISAGTLSIDIVDGSYVTVGSPAVTFTTAPFSFTCQTATGTFGTTTQRIYIKNPDAADNGWTASLAASAPTAFWDGAVSDYDFNDATSAGCTDGGDTDSLGGQMTVDPSGATLATGVCGSCVTTNITKGSSNAYVEGSVNSITLLTAAAGSNDVGDWHLQTVAVSQKIPAEQGAASDYDINMTLSVVAS
jgi:hypothetical protein